MNDRLNLIIQAIASIGTIGAFLFLFRRDKDKQAQIDKLSGIATILEAQNETMKNQNELIAQQVDIFKDTLLLKGADQETMRALQKIEEKKLRLSVEPDLWTNGGGYFGATGEFSIDLNNKGETAMLEDFVNKSDDVIITNTSLPYELEKGAHRKIFGKQKGEKHISDCDIEIDVIYTDRLKNRFSSKIKGRGMNIKIVDVKDL